MPDGKFVSIHAVARDKNQNKTTGDCLQYFFCARDSLLIWVAICFKIYLKIIQNLLDNYIVFDDNNNVRGWETKTPKIKIEVWE